MNERLATIRFPKAAASAGGTGTVRRPYLRHFAVAVGIWVGLYAALTLTADPYGISPIGVAQPHFNRYKPKRLDIDRLIKPYEVWRYQPRTIFLGTSRIHQSIDPAIFDHTDLASAYNASVPANSLGMNISYLTEYVKLDPHLRNAFAELFLYNFLGQGQSHQRLSFRQMVTNTATLFVSYNTLWDAIYTVWYNLEKNKPCYEIKPGGYFYYPPGHDAKGTFDAFPVGMWDIDRRENGKPMLSNAAFSSVDELMALAHHHHIALRFVLTPEHPYVWYYIDTTHRWDLIQDWLTRLTEKTPILSFSQPNSWVYEPVRHHMVYWNDPFHFSLAMGRGIEASLIGHPDPSVPANFMVLLTPEMVPQWVADQRAAVRRWALQNQPFVAAFEAEKKKARAKEKR